MAGRRAGEKDKIAALDNLYQTAGTYRRGPEFAELLNFIKKFPNIAPFNAMLLHAQRPGARFVLSARDWERKYGRSIKPGARPLVILWPFGPVQFVFDVSDTDGEHVPDEVSRPFAVNGKLDPYAFALLLENLGRIGVTLTRSKFGSQAAGCISRVPEGRSWVVPNLAKGKGNKNSLYRIRHFASLVINGDAPTEDQFATITHELGHMLCGHLGSIPSFCYGRHGCDPSAREFEAESISWLVCERVGLKNPSAGYLNGYMNKDHSLPNISLDQILKASGFIESMLRSLVTPPKGLQVSD